MIPFLIRRLRPLLKSESCALHCGLIYKLTIGLPDRFLEERSQTDVRYFLTISAFSIIAMPPRSAILPFRVMVLPQ